MTFESPGERPESDSELASSRDSGFPFAYQAVSGNRR